MLRGPKCLTPWVDLMSILLPLFITPFGLRSGGKAKLNILALVSPYSEKPKVRYVSDFNLGSFT